MKKILFIALGLVFLTACSQKEVIVKKHGDSADQQYQKAQKAWNELDKE